MPAPKFLSGLPKPVLFGLYGAVGGLIGALAFGELLWYLLKPPAPVEEPPPPPVPQVAITASPQVTVYTGGENTFDVQIARAHFDGPVTVTFEVTPRDMADGVRAPSIEIPAGKTSGTAKVTVRPTADPNKLKIEGKATATAGDKPIEAKLEAPIKLDVQPAPKAEPRMAISVSPKIQVYQRGANEFSVQIARGDFDGRVTLTFENLPDGAKVPNVTIPAGEDRAKVELTAGGTTPTGSKEITVKAKATIPAGDGKSKDVEADTSSTLEVLASQAAPVDIVFVLDVTGSMGPFLEGVKDGIKDFVTGLEKAQLDARVALLAFGDRVIGEDSELLKFGPDNDPFTTDIDAFKREVGKLKLKGGGDIPESSLDSLVDSSKLKFRDKATPVLVLITDAPPKLPDKDTKDVATAVNLLKQSKVKQVHVMSRPGDHKDHYKPFTDEFKGKHFDIEGVPAGRVKFADILPDLGKEIVRLVAVEGAKPDVPSSAPPVAPPPAAAGVATPKSQEAAAPKLPEPEVKVLASSEKAAKGSEAQVVAQVGVWTAAIAALVCFALLTGQANYLTGGFPGALSVLAGLGGGLLVGLIGGAAGQGLYFLAPDSAVLGAIFRVLGWALLGGLAGTGLALFIPNLKPVYGLAGGAIGGAVGALGFIAIASLGSDLAGRLAGGLLLGFCIGLMVAIVEAAFRTAWLEVKYGPRESVTVNLGTEPVKIGGDAKACTVWARGAPPIAMRYFIRNGQIICEDGPTRTEEVVTNGATREAGNVTVVVRTGRGKSPAPPPPPRPAAPRRSSDDDDFLPMDPVRSRAAPAPAKPQASAAAKPEPLGLDDDDDMMPLPPPAAPARPPAAPAAAPKPPAPAAAPRPTAPAAPPPRPPAPAAAPKPPTAPPAAAPPKPATPTPAKSPDGCPQCGRKIPGAVGKRYCMMCDETF